MYQMKEDKANISSITEYGHICILVLSAREKFNSMQPCNIIEYKRHVWTLLRLGVGDVCFFLTMRCFNDAMFSNS